MSIDFRSAALSIVAALLAAGSVAAAEPPRVYTLEPPVGVREPLDQLRRGADRTAATDALAARDDAAPYLRFELALATDPLHKRDLADALKAVEDRAAGRNRRRFAWWAATRRFDLCAELIVACPDKQEALALINIATPELHALAGEAAGRLGFRFGEGDVRPLPSRLDRHPRCGYFAGEAVTVSRDFFGECLIARADTFEFGAAEIVVSFVAARSGLRYTNTRQVSNEWEGCIVLVNSSMSIRAADASLFICDGDVELTDLHRLHCVIIANGHIRGGGVQSSVLCAAGDITARGGQSLFYAGGKAPNAPADAAAGRKEEGRKVLPFGVRFLDPREFGLELAAQNGGVQVVGIAPESVFARYGVEDADVVTAVDDAPVNSLPAFRQALRRGVVRESVVLRIRRGDQQLARIVFLDGVPAPPAPPPRAVNR